MATESCPRCVLLVEDDEPLRESVRVFLEQRGYTIVPATDAQAAMDLLLETELPRPCLVLVDLITIHFDWPNLFGALNADDQVATLPMALIAAGTSPNTSERLKKPLDFEILDRIVQGHCCGGDRGGGTTAGERNSLHGGGSP
jgi:DNA-binding response OmpR family regulator